ncbi:hypothetical protein D3C72_1560330 [compost metagenome]
MPCAVTGTPMREARARPSEAGSMPTMVPIVRCRPWRMTLIIRSVPILPEPMMATGIFLLSGFIMVPGVLFREHGAHFAEAFDAGH